MHPTASTSPLSQATPGRLKRLAAIALALTLLLLGFSGPGLTPARASSPAPLPEGLSPAEWAEISAHVQQSSYQDRPALSPLAVDPIAQQAYLKASNTQEDDSFGRSLALSGNTLVVGAPFEDSNAGGVNGDQTNDLAPDAGAVYVFTRSGGVWSQQAYLKASNTGGGDEFGWSLALSGDTLLVGASQEDSNATGVNGDQANNSASEAGAAYVFTRTGGLWSQQAYLKASNTEEGDQFGWSVALSGDTLVVGADQEDSNTGGVNGDQANNSAPEAGVAYVFAAPAQPTYLPLLLKEYGPPK